MRGCSGSAGHTQGVWKTHQETWAFPHGFRAGPEPLSRSLCRFVHSVLDSGPTAAREAAHAPVAAPLLVRRWLLVLLCGLRCSSPAAVRLAHRSLGVPRVMPTQAACTAPWGAGQWSGAAGAKTGQSVVPALGPWSRVRPSQSPSGGHKR